MEFIYEIFFFCDKRNWVPHMGMRKWFVVVQQRKTLSTS